MSYNRLFGNALESSQTKPIVPPKPAYLLPQLQWVSRQTAVLEANPWPDQPDVLAVNLLRPCVQKCSFCLGVHRRELSPHSLSAYRNTAQHLHQELFRRVQQPKAILINPLSEPALPFLEVQQEVGRVVQVLALHRTQAWLLTRNYLRPCLLARLAEHRELVRITLPMCTLDAELQRKLEPGSASPKVRLKQLTKLKQLGVPVHVSLEPLVPGVTDTREQVLPLLRALAEAGVQQISVGYWTVQAGVRDSIQAGLAELGWLPRILNEFSAGPVSTLGKTQAKLLPKARRERGYAKLMAWAADFKMRVTVSSTSNPDFAAKASESAPQRLLLSVLAAQQRQLV